MSDAGNLSLKVHTAAARIANRHKAIVNDYEAYRRIKRTMNSNPELNPAELRRKALLYHKVLSDNQDHIEKSLAIFKELKQFVDDTIEKKEISARLTKAIWTVDLALARELTRLGNQLIKQIQREIRLVENDLADLVDKVVITEFIE